MISDEYLYTYIPLDSISTKFYLPIDSDIYPVVTIYKARFSVTKRTSLTKQLLLDIKNIHCINIDIINFENKIEYNTPLFFIPFSDASVFNGFNTIGFIGIIDQLIEIDNLLSSPSAFLPKS